MVVIYDTSSLIKQMKAGKEFTEEDDKTTILSVIEFPKILEKSFGIIYPRSTTYEIALMIAKKLLANGTPVNTVDIVVAAIAIEKAVPLVTNDRHFELIQGVDNRLLLQSE
jgi:hypothetical protein